MKEKLDKTTDKLRKKALGSSKLKFFTRFGYLVRGAIYALLGLLGLGFSIGLRENGSGFTEAIIFVQNQPFGQVLLASLVLGFASFSIWGLLRGILNVNKEEGKVGFFVRMGYLSSAFSYGSLALTTLLFIRGFSIQPDSHAQQELANRILYLTFGRQLLVVVGVSWVIAGIAQGIIAFKEKFKKHIDFKKMGERKEDVGILMGKIGIASRGIIFILIGAFIIKAALKLDPSSALGTDKVMEAIKSFTLGPIILGVICGGLMVFGAFSIFQGIYLKTPSE